MRCGSVNEFTEHNDTEENETRKNDKFIERRIATATVEVHAFPTRCRDRAGVCEVQSECASKEQDGRRNEDLRPTELLTTIVSPHRVPVRDCQHDQASGTAHQESSKWRETVRTELKDQPADHV
jgi:hypothetical protein